MPAHRFRSPDTPWYRRLPHLSAWAWTGVLTVLAAVVIGVLLLGRDDPDPSRTATGAPKVPVPTITATAATSAAPSGSAPATVPPPTWPGDADLPEGAVASGNTYLVGADIPAGVYTTGGAENPDRLLCFWAKERRSGGTSVARKSTGADYGPMTVELPAGTTFQSQGCKEWHRVP